MAFGISPEKYGILLRIRDKWSVLGESCIKKGFIDVSSF
jgi:hypothetical protein